MKKGRAPGVDEFTKANKAIYETGDASKLWNDLVHETMVSNDYVRNPYDKCCYNKVVVSFLLCNFRTAH